MLELYNRVCSRTTVFKILLGPESPPLDVNACPVVCGWMRDFMADQRGRKLHLLLHEDERFALLCSVCGDWSSYQLGLFGWLCRGYATEYGKRAIRQARGGYRPGYRLEQPITQVIVVAYLRHTFDLAPGEPDPIAPEAAFDDKPARKHAAPRASRVVLHKLDDPDASMGELPDAELRAAD